MIQTTARILTWFAMLVAAALPLAGQPDQTFTSISRNLGGFAFR